MKCIGEAGQALTRHDVLIVLAVVGFYSLFFALNPPIHLGEGDYYDLTYPADYPVPWRYRVIPIVAPLVSGALHFLWPPLSFDTWWRLMHWVLTVVLFAAYYVLLRRCLGVSRSFATLGLLGIAVTYPLLFGYGTTVHLTVGDLIGYCLSTLSLILVMSGNYWGFVIIAVIAVLTRETNLMIVLPLLFDRQANWYHKFLGLLAPTLGVVGIRLWLGWESEYLWVGWFTNLISPIWVNAGFVFVSLGVFWVIGVVAWLYFLPHIKTLPRNWWLLWVTLPVVTVAMLFANIAFAILSENRILFALFPWVVSLSVVYLETVAPNLFPLSRIQILLTAAAISLALLLIFGSVFLAGIGKTSGYEIDKSLAILFSGSWKAGLTSRFLFLQLGLSGLFLAWRAVAKGRQNPALITSIV